MEYDITWNEEELEAILTLRRANICSRQCSHLRTYVLIEKAAL